MTDGEVQVYFDDLRATIHSSGAKLRFYSPDVGAIRCDGQLIQSDRCGRHCLEGYIPEGKHEIALEILSDANALTPHHGSSVSPSYLQLCCSGEELQRRAATAQPGDTLVIRNGVYEDFEAVLTCSGQDGNPIVIKPETPGGVEFCRQSRVTLTGDHMVLREFRFDNCETTRACAVAVEGSHNRVTQCQFSHCGNPTLSWAAIVRIEMKSHYNRVDHCFWTGSYSQSLVQRNDQRRPGTHGVGNRYDHNVFRDIIRIWENGQENIQLGQGRPHVADMHALVEYNLFDRAWGDSEICSNKTSSNTFRFNVAAWCPRSALTLRGGRNVLVSSNLFYRCGGGLSISDRDHRIINNVIINSEGPGICLNNAASRYDLADNILIAHNVIHGNNGAIAIGGYAERRSDDDAPRNVQLVNNIIQGNAGVLIDIDKGRDFLIDHNAVFASESAVIGNAGQQAILTDPMVELRTPIGYPGRPDTVRDRGRLLDEVRHDRIGNPRPIGDAPDIGAYELTGRTPDVDGPQMPPVPEERPSIDEIIEQSKGTLLVPSDKLRNNEHWDAVGEVEESAGAYEVTNGSLRLLADVPDDFIAEWDYQPSEFQAMAAALFAGDGKKSAYELSWGGANSDRKPAGIILLKKNEHLIARGPDAFNYRMNYYPIRYLNNIVRIPETRPDPTQWYHFRLMRRDGEITALLNRQRIRDRFDLSTFGDVPVILWDDQGERAGPVLDGGRFSFRQQGKGSWRDIRIWSCR